jgi:hypothetical protein
VRLKEQKGLNLKEEEQMLSACSTSSNNCNVDSLILFAAEVSLIRQRSFPRQLKGETALRRTG